MSRTVEILERELKLAHDHIGLQAVRIAELETRLGSTWEPIPINPEPLTNEQMSQAIPACEPAELDCSWNCEREFWFCRQGNDEIEDTKATNELASWRKLAVMLWDLDRDGAP